MAETPQHTITALRYYGPKDLRLEQIPSRACRPNEVRVKIAYCGICGSDIHEYLGGPIFPPKAGETNPWTGESLPVTLGYGFSRVIVELGSAVNGLQVGSRVSVNPALDDRHYQVEPLHNLPNRKAQHLQTIMPRRRTSGAPHSRLALHSTLRIPTQTDSRGIGAGPIGSAIVMLLQAWGAGHIVVSETTPSRKRMAMHFGADTVVNPADATEQDQVLSAVREVNADGVDVAFDATRLQATLDIAIAAIWLGEIMFNVAIHERPLQLNLNKLVCFEK
ncbi:hypothetical protein N8T08_003693 [Aspergillus melleus]|uniref:Uncharacterized protein n=1 Tax=Aspergillus melleus TaxID=138277 RepID=A0ACC3B6H9_9EURO|nr:hypothetical protein N8T08_003693 [Aspergillus melleus]